MATNWNSPLLGTLESVDALALQQIFRSLAFELARINKEIDQLKGGTVGQAVDKDRLG